MAASSSMFCDVVGHCSINSCLNLDANVPKEKRQIVYYLFEQLSGVSHLMAGSARATDLAGSYTVNRAEILVQTYTSARRIEEAERTKALNMRIAFAAVSAATLLASGAIPFGGIGQIGAAAASWSTSGIAGNLLTSGYIGAVGMSVQ